MSSFHDELVKAICEKTGKSPEEVEKEMDENLENATLLDYSGAIQLAKYVSQKVELEEILDENRIDVNKQSNPPQE